MARYDRIAPLLPPSRETAFPGWPILRDIEGNDRDTDLARRARLRFLALRPVRRLLDRGVAGVGRDSFLAQIEAVREELGYLPTRDVERGRLARFLHNIEERENSRVIGATIEMAEACAAAGQLYGAEEFAVTALGLALLLNEQRLLTYCYVTLARIARGRGEWATVEEFAAKAALAAQNTTDVIGYVYAEAERAAAAATRGEANNARQILDETLKRARLARETHAEALVQAKLCAIEISMGNAAAALEHGWLAVRQLDDLRERALLLEQLGNAFSTLGQHKAAERCFTMVAQRGVDPALRARARAAQAVQAAALANSTLFRERRNAILNDTAEWAADLRVFAFVNLELGRGSLMCGDTDDARESLRAAITTAQRHSLKDIIADAEELLTALEQKTTQHFIKPGGTGAAAEAARRLAEQLEALPDLPVLAV